MVFCGHSKLLWEFGDVVDLFYIMIGFQQQKYLRVARCVLVMSCSARDSWISLEIMFHKYRALRTHPKKTCLQKTIHPFNWNIQTKLIFGSAIVWFLFLLGLRLDFIFFLHPGKWNKMGTLLIKHNQRMVVLNRICQTCFLKLKIFLRKQSTNQKNTHDYVC